MKTKNESEETPKEPYVFDLSKLKFNDREARLFRLRWIVDRLTQIDPPEIKFASAEEFDGYLAERRRKHDFWKEHLLNLEDNNPEEFRRFLALSIEKKKGYLDALLEPAELALVLQTA